MACHIGREHYTRVETLNSKGKDGQVKDLWINVPGMFYKQRLGHHE